MNWQKIINNKKNRAYFSQASLIIVLVAVFAYLAGNAIENLTRQGIASGWGFLEMRAGFDLKESLVSYSAESTYGRAYLVGLVNTILVSVFGIILASILGFFIGIARLSDNWLVSRMAYWYVELTRNIPVLLWIYVWYYAVFLKLPVPKKAITLGDSLVLTNRGMYIPKPEFLDNFLYVVITFVVAVVAFIAYRLKVKQIQNDTGKQLPLFSVGFGLIIGLPIVVFFLMGSPVQFDYPALKGFNFKGGMHLSPQFSALWMGLSVYTSAAIAEAVRSGIMAVDKGQTEASYSVNLTSRQTMWMIVIPQSMRVIVPPLNSQYMNLMKNSSLAIATGYMDVTGVMGGVVLNQTGQALECMAAVMATYLILSLIISIVMNIINKRVQIVER